MTEKAQPIEDRLARIEAKLARLTETATTIESRIEIIHQEAQRSSTQMHRLGINQESAKLSANRHEQALKALSEEIAGLRRALAAD